MTGRLIVFEGPEGAGKSTQIRHLARMLQDLGHPVTLTREPGGTDIGMRIRQLLLDPEVTMTAQTEYLLFCASREQLVHDVILPALEAGEVVLCDRYMYSSFAYQGYGRMVKDALDAGLDHWPHPDFAFFLDLPPEVGLQRVAARGQPDRMEQADLAFHHRVREGFLECAKRNRYRHILIDANRSEAEVWEDIWQCTEVCLQRPALKRRHLKGAS